ncbi:MAG TPA: hypothetical protein PL110_08250 [Candidatus Eremiobacteraeota bacterium]|nr:MAG: hypothetical protein BWY64_02163 [bacterium ADurb.Bin363]HPZ08091.1 hypothetical protein [Candidatus Eremiobacteraeota bacterium]
MEMEIKNEDKPIELGYKFKVGDIIVYEQRKLIKEKINLNTNTVFNSKEENIYRIIQKVINVDKDNIATMEINITDKETNKEKERNIKINNKGKIISGYNDELSNFSFPEEKVKVKATWVDSGIIYLSLLELPVEFKTHFLFSGTTCIHEYNCIKIDISGEEICSSIENCRHKTSYGGEIYLAYEEGIVVKSIKRSNILAKIDNYLLDSNIEIRLDLKNYLPFK